MLYFPKQTISHMFCIIGEIQVLLDALTRNPNKSFLWLNKEEEEEPAASTSVFISDENLSFFNKEIGKSLESLFFFLSVNSKLNLQFFLVKFSKSFDIKKVLNYII